MALLEERGDGTQQARAVEALLDLAIARADVRKVLMSLSAALLHEDATEC